MMKRSAKTLIAMIVSVSVDLGSVNVSGLLVMMNVKSPNPNPASKLIAIIAMMIFFFDIVFGLL